MVDDYTLGKALGKIKRICIEKIDNIIRSLVDLDHNVSGGTTFKNAVILVICVTKNGVRFYLQLFLEELLYDE